METLLIVACLLGVAAIAFNLWGRRQLMHGDQSNPVRAAAGRRIAAARVRRQPGQSGAESWLTRGLYRGDLRALSLVARGDFAGVPRDQMSRLGRRGFVAESAWGRCCVTLRGRFALLLRRSLPPA